MTSTLSLKKTHKYVGSCDYLDDWEDVGTLQEIGSSLERSEDDEDPCDPVLHTHWLIVSANEGETKARIEEALRDTFTRAGCAHEYDCCGCRSYYVTDSVNVTGDLWKVVVHSSRNY